MPRAADEKNRPLVEDIRLLGRILGDVIREQEGREAFDLVERVRQLSVAYRLKRDAGAGRSLDRLLKNLSNDQTVSVIRAFSYFSHLANLAEDRHHVRRRDLHEQRPVLHRRRAEQRHRLLAHGHRDERGRNRACLERALGDPCDRSGRAGAERGDGRQRPGRAHLDRPGLQRRLDSHRLHRHG
jgi:phosphoenolpyruvate carboxylase